MKKNLFLLFALMLFAGAAHGVAIDLVNDNSEPANANDLRASLNNDIIYVGLGLGRAACITAVITTEDNETLYYKETGVSSAHKFLLNYLGIPNGKYTLNVFWNNTWWRGDFVFKSHKPEGLNVYVDSTYYRLNNGTAVTVEPDINGRTRSLRMYWNIYERDYPLDVVIPSKLAYNGKAYQVVGVEGGSFQYCHFLQSVSLPNTITSIGDCAFAGCDNLPSIDIPESVTELGSGVFSKCTKLSKIAIPEGITTLREQMFVGCKNLCSVTLPSSLTKIERWAFHSCSSLPKIDIPYNVTSIGEYAFFGCTSLTSITLPEDITKIDDFAFSGMPDEADIYCKAKNPCEIAANTFNYNCILHVPKGSLNKYLNADNWCNFTYIEEFDNEDSGNPVYAGDMTGVEPAVEAESAERFYDLQGRPVDGTQKGILIRNGKKVLVK